MVRSLPGDPAALRLPRFEDLAMSAAFGVAAFLVGGLFFRYMKRGFADVL